MSNNTSDRRMTVWRLLHWWARHFPARRFNYTYEPIECTGPCLIIANHVTNLDPFFVGLAHRDEPLTYVASEHIFRMGMRSKLITKLIDPIPRSKAASGADTVKAILRRIKNGESVVLFAEGDCTWDGITKGIFPATGKLAKVCGASLVTFRIEGGYLTHPRWAKKSRRGSMRGAPVRIYSREELAQMTPSEVTGAINRDIYVNAWEDQNRDMIPFRSKAPAEGLERALFICPECGGTDCMESKGDRFYCSKCVAEWKMDEFGFLHGPKFQTIAQWDEWQEEAVKNIKGTPLFGGSGSFTDVNSGDSLTDTDYSLDADHGRMFIRSGLGKPKIKVLSRIGSMAMVKTNRLLFEDNESYFEIKSKRGVLRPYLMLWQATRSEGDK